MDMNKKETIEAIKEVLGNEFLEVCYQIEQGGSVNDEYSEDYLTITFCDLNFPIALESKESQLYVDFDTYVKNLQNKVRERVLPLKGDFEDIVMDDCFNQNYSLIRNEYEKIPVINIIQ